MTRILSRRSVLLGLSATILFPAPAAQAAGYIRQPTLTSVRRLWMYSAHTGEHINTTYWTDGSYIADAVEEINHFFRDWRTDDVKSIDLRTLDILAATHHILDVHEPYLLISGYRSPKTNAMLQTRSKGVAKNSLHLKGQAADVRLSSRSVSQIGRAASSCRAGGVGRYFRSNFVHVDCGPVRSWGK